MAHLLEIQGYNRRGGSERHTAILARALAGRGWRVTVAAPPGGLLDEPGVLGDAAFLPVSLSGRYDVRSLLRLIDFIRRESVELVHTHCRNADLIGGAAARLTRRPLAATLHGLLVGADGSVGNDLVNRLHRRFLATAPDLLLGISEAVSQAAARLGIPPDRIATVPNGAEPPGATEVNAGNALRTSLRRTSDEVLIVQAGVLEPSKDPTTLLDAALELIDAGLPVRLVFVGSGSLEATLRATATRRGALDRVEFPGTVAHAGPYLAAADVVALSSRWEGFGRVLIEAMSYGRPVAASRTGGIPEIVADGMTGLLVEPGSVAAWAAALRDLVVDPARREAMGRRGLARFHESFSAGRFVERTEARLLSIVRGTAKAAIAASPRHAERAGEAAA